MLNDRQASELISLSLSGSLGADEASIIDEHLAKNPKSQAFARLSQIIQDSVSGIGDLAAAGDASIAPGLSAAAKDRMRESLRLEVSKSKSQFADTYDSDQHASTNDDQAPTFASGQASPWPPATAARQLVSRYTLLRKLGAGGLGTVWLARDEKLKRTVAIKEMNATAAESPKAWQRFNREAEITGLLEHPNVVPLYQFGSDPKSGLPFYAMRFLGKSTLANAIVEFHERRKSGDHDCVGLYRLLTAFMGVCQAIAYAHSRGVIHRDLKPENVALDNFGQVIVLDWGLAKLTADAETRLPLGQGPALIESEASQTLAGEVVGTPLYMAPEQAAGDLDRVDEQTDVYGLGAILFAILTGMAPHENSKYTHNGERPVPELLKTIAESASPSPRDINPSVPADLDAICRKAMARRSYFRYESAADLADAVQRWMAGQNAKREQYENMRFEGRDIRSMMVACLRDLGTNARFMANLPPTQGIIAADRKGSAEDLATWRDRLSTIFKGLLHANTDFNAVSFVKVSEGQASELIRVERHSTEYSTVRSVPLSRLRTAPAPDFYQHAARHKPDEVYAGLLSDFAGLDVHEGTACAGKTGYFLASAVPVFDEKTEEVFGVLVVEARLHRFIKENMNQRRGASQAVYIVNESSRVISQWSRDQNSTPTPLGSDASEVFPEWSKIRDRLLEGQDFVDETNRDLFATSLSLCGAGDNMAIVLKS